MGEPFMEKCREASSDFLVKCFRADQLPLQLSQALLIWA